MLHCYKLITRYFILIIANLDDNGLVHTKCSTVHSILAGISGSSDKTEEEMIKYRFN